MSSVVNGRQRQGERVRINMNIKCESTNGCGLESINREAVLALRSCNMFKTRLEISTDLDNLLLGDNVRQASHVDAVTCLWPVGRCKLFVRCPGVRPVWVVGRGAIVPPVVASVGWEAVVGAPVASTFAFVVSAPASCRFVRTNFGQSQV